MPSIRVKRGTRAQIEAAKTASTLAAGEVYLITDEARLAVGTAVNAYTPAATQAEARIAVESLLIPPEAAGYPATIYAQYKSVSGTNFAVSSLAFDATTEEAVFFRFVARNYASGNLTVRIRWYADTATTGGVTWGVRLAAITPDTDTQDVETKAFATEQEANDTHLATTGQRLHEAVLTLSNLDSLAARDDVTLRLARKVANANDTMTGDALVVGLIVEYAS